MSEYMHDRLRAQREEMRRLDAFARQLTVHRTAAMEHGMSVTEAIERGIAAKGEQ